MCSECNESTPENTNVEAPKSRRRQKLWELRGSLHCSILGTCLSHDDLLRLASKCNIKLPSDIRPYDLHAYFVEEAGKAAPLSRATHKLLDRRYHGILRKVATCKTPEELVTLWEAEYDAGRIAGAYWAFLSYNHVPFELVFRIFGEVHMLSHVLGRVTHETASRAADMQLRIDELEARLERMTQRQKTLVAARDKAISEVHLLRDQIIARETHQTKRQLSDKAKHSRVGNSKFNRKFVRIEQVLISTRERARIAEKEAATFRDEVQRLKILINQQAAQPHSCSCPAADICDERVCSSEARSVLYIGGRTGAVERLRRIATRADAELLHHDGGEEHALGRIDGLVQGCDAVFRPIDCVSHSACLKAKALCKKFRKPFVPLRSSGGTSFEKALAALPLMQ
jgi:hypothetical protein